jgi:hypothetical protein
VTIFKQRQEDAFKTVLFIVVVLFNIYFLALWLYYFLTVLARKHFSKIQWVFGKLFGGKLRPVDEYETNLEKWL